MRTLTALALGILSTAALAADKPSFEAADSNDDGKVSIAEAKKAGVPASKAKANDLNGDGELTKADWRFIDLDSDNDERR